MTLSDEELKLIRKLAWLFYKTTRFNFDDLFQEAAYAYLKGKEKHVNGKSKVTTYCYKNMVNWLIDFTRKEKNYHKYLSLSDKELPQIPVYFYQKLEPISLIIDIIIKNREKFENLKPRKARGAIRKLLKQKGYTNYQIEKNMKKLEFDLIEMVN